MARGFGLNLTDEELETYRPMISSGLAAYDRLEQLAEPVPKVRYPRGASYRPDPEENPLGAWYRRCSIRGAESGSLAGKRVAIKDNVCVTGVPMMNGTSALEGYTPEFDATISHPNTTRVVRSPARPSASTCASPAAATPRLPDRS